MRGAELLVQALVAGGISKVFSLSGNQIMSIYDACIDAKIDLIHTRHEAAAVFMADAYAQLSGEVGVCLVTAGPGAANTLGSLYTARRSESPIVLLSGDSALDQDGSGAFQELDQVAMTQAVTKYSARVKSTEQLGAEFAIAVRTARSGRPGPVHLALPVNLLEGDVALTDSAIQGVLSTFNFNRPCRPLEQDALTQLGQLVAAASTPVFVVGPAMSETRLGAKLSLLAEAMDCPVIAMESPRGLKDPSLGDVASAMDHSDLIISLGKSIDFMLGFGASAIGSSTRKWIVVDADANELDRARFNLSDALILCLQADPIDVCDQLITNDNQLDHLPRHAWRHEVAGLLARRSPQALSQNDAADKPVGLTSASLCAGIQKFINQLPQDTVVICDGGEFGQWSQASVRGTMRLINGPAGAIGGGLCYAIAAVKAKPDATVFAMMGDGTVGFHFAEFETAVREKTPFVCIIGNDKRWNAEHLIQLHRFGPDRLMGCELTDARYDKAAEALGGHGEFVSDLSELDAALKRAIDSGLAACVNVDIEGLAAPKV